MHTHKTNSRHDANKRETMCGRLVQGISKDTSRSGHPHVILLRVRAPQFRTEMFCKKHLLYAEGLSGERRSAGSRKARPIFMRHTKMYPSCLSLRQEYRVGFPDPIRIYRSCIYNQIHVQCRQGKLYCVGRSDVWRGTGGHTQIVPFPHPIYDISSFLETWRPCALKVT